MHLKVCSIFKRAALDNVCTDSPDSVQCSYGKTAFVHQLASTSDVCSLCCVQFYLRSFTGNSCLLLIEMRLMGKSEKEPREALVKFC